MGLGVAAALTPSDSLRPQGTRRETSVNTKSRASCRSKRLRIRHIRVFGRESGWLADGRSHATPSAWQRVVETWFAGTYLTCWIDHKVDKRDPLP
jgi:hypothetical protein